VDHFSFVLPFRPCPLLCTVLKPRIWFSLTWMSSKLWKVWKSLNRVPILFCFFLLCGWYASQNVGPHPVSLQRPDMPYIIRAMPSVLSQKINLQRRNLYCNDKPAIRPMSSRSPKARLNILYRQRSSYGGRFYSHVIRNMIRVFVKLHKLLGYGQTEKRASDKKR
jgi:hypothetical protein